MKDRILIALDVSTRHKALELVDSLRGLTSTFKIGMQLYMAEGPSLVREIVEGGGHVFLDMKFHDIPNTVSKAVVEAANLGVSMMTIHASGGRAMMEAVSGELSNHFGNLRPLVVAVTVLTSLDEANLKEIGVDGSMDGQVLRLARLAESCGIDGIVCSPREVRKMRLEMGHDFKIVTPGIRPPGGPPDDQQRTATPGEAIADGADYLVVGRPVTGDPDPRAALERILQAL